MFYQGRDVNGIVSNDDNCAVKRDIMLTQQLVVRRSAVVGADESSLNHGGTYFDSFRDCSKYLYTRTLYNWPVYEKIRTNIDKLRSVIYTSLRGLRPAYTFSINVGGRLYLSRTLEGLLLPYDSDSILFRCKYF